MARAVLEDNECACPSALRRIKSEEKYIVKRKKGRHAACAAAPEKQYKSAIHEAIHRQFMAIHMFFGNPSFNRCPQIRKTERVEAIIPAGCTPCKILISGIERMGTVCGDMCSA